MEICAKRPASLTALMAIAIPLLTAGLIASVDGMVDVEPTVDLSLPKEGDGLDMVGAPEEIFKAPASSNFYAIPGIVFTSESKEAKVKTRQQCEDACMAGIFSLPIQPFVASNFWRAAEKCRSITYRARDSRCLLSPKKLTYKIGWKLFIAVQKLNAAGLKQPTDKYRKFNDLYFPDKKYEASSQNEADCQFLCTQGETTAPALHIILTCVCLADKNCAVFSYFAARDTCQLGGEGVDFDAEFNYYERNHVIDPNQQEPAKEELPENAEQEGKLEKVKNEVHIVPPEVTGDHFLCVLNLCHIVTSKPESVSEFADLFIMYVTELNAQLAKEAAKIKQMDQSINENKLDPRLSVNPENELATKKVIKDEENEQTARFEAGVRQEKSLSTIDLITRNIQLQESDVIKEGKSKAVDIAKTAFDRGANKSNMKNREQFTKDMAKLKDQLRQAGLDSNSGNNPHLVKKEKRDKYNEKARKNLDKLKAIERQKELDKKHQKRDDVLALSRKVSKLVNDERAAKQAKLRTIELAGKANEHANAHTIEKVMEERHQKKLSSHKRNSNLAKVNLKFQTMQLADKSNQLLSRIQIGKEEQKVKAELKKQKERRQKQIAAASGAKERGKKDEEKAKESQVAKTAIESAQKLNKKTKPKA